MPDDPAALGVGEVAVGPPQERLDPAHQLAQPERLGQVVVGAELQADDLVDLVVAGREHQDRRLGAGGAEAAQDLEAVDAGQPDVEDDEVRRLADGQLEALLAGLRQGHRVALLLEGVLDAPGDGVLVLDDQDGGGHAAILHRTLGADRRAAGLVVRYGAHPGRLAAAGPAGEPRPATRRHHHQSRGPHP